MTRRTRAAALVGALAMVTAALLVAYSTVAHADRLLYPERRSLLGSAGRFGYLTPADAGLVYEDVTLRATDGVELKGWYAPVGAARGGKAALLIHGHQENRVSVLQLTRLFSGLGFSLALFDLRHHGQSGGNHFTMGVRESEDAALAARWLLARGHDPRRLVVFGVSMGAMIALATQAETSLFCAVIADSPSSDLRETVLDYSRRNPGFPVFWPSLAIRLAERLGGFDLDRMRASDHVRRIRCPLLLIHGEADKRIPPSHSRRLAALTAGPVETLFVPGAGHAQAIDADRPRYDAAIASFLRRHVVDP